MKIFKKHNFFTGGFSNEYAVDVEYMDFTGKRTKTFWFRYEAAREKFFRKMRGRIGRDNILRVIRYDVSDKIFKR